MSPTDLPDDYGERIRQLRVRLRLSQGRLGELLGVTAGTVSRWESGQLSPSSGVWHRIVEAEELGLAALLRQERAPLEVRETTEPYGQPPRLDFEADPEEAGEQGTMTEPSKPKGEHATSEPEEEKGNIEKLLALIAKWQAEPGDYDERAAAVIDPLIAERRIALHNLDERDWERWKHP